MMINPEQPRVRLATSCDKEYNPEQHMVLFLSEQAVLPVRD
jgi:hypothetical protein